MDEALQVARTLELQILLEQYGVRISARAQVLLIQELRAKTDIPDNKLATFALAAVLRASGREEHLAKYHVQATSQTESWVPRAKELLFEATREIQERLYRKGL